MEQKPFSPADGVTLDNALQFIEAINAAVRRDIPSVDRTERSMLIGIVAAALNQTSESLGQFRAKLEQAGQATPISEEQKAQLRLFIRGAKSKRKPES